MRIQIADRILTPTFPNTYPKLRGIQKSTRIQICNTHLVSRGSSDLNSCSIFNYAFDVSLRVDSTNTFLYKALYIQLYNTYNTYNTYNSCNTYNTYLMNGNYGIVVFVVQIKNLVFSCTTIVLKIK
jgi:hypothetical protein